MAPKILTDQEITEWLELNQDDPDLPSIQRLAEAVETHVENLLNGYKLSSAAQTDLAVDGRGTEDLIAPHAPITALTAVKIGRDSTDPDTTLDTTDPDEVVWDANGLITRTDGGTFPRKRKYVLLTYTAGWTKATVPADIKTVLQLLLGYLWRSRGREAVKNELLSGMLNWTGRAIEEVPGVKQVISFYTRPVVASIF